MFGIKVGTQVSEGRARMVVKLEPEMLGLNWDKGDYVRVMTNRDENKVTLKRVAGLSPKNVVHKLTTTGGGNFDHMKGIYLSYKENRFKKPLKKSTLVFADNFKVLDEETVEFEVPEEVFVQ